MMEIFRYALDDGPSQEGRGARCFFFVIQSEGCAGACAERRISRVNGSATLLSFGALLAIMMEILRYALDDGSNRRYSSFVRCSSDDHERSFAASG